MNRLQLPALFIPAFYCLFCSVGPSFETGMVEYEITSPHSQDSSSGTLTVYFRPGQASALMGVKGEPSAVQSIFFYDQDSMYSIFKNGDAVSMVVPMRISQMQPAASSKKFVLYKFAERRQILGYDCHRFQVRTADTLRDNMVIAGWLTPAIRTKFNPLMVEVDLPGLPLEWSVRRAASSTAPDMEFRAAVIDTSVSSDVFIIPEASEQPEEDEEDDDDPPEVEEMSVKVSSGWQINVPGGINELLLEHPDFEATLKIQRYDTDTKKTAWKVLERHMTRTVEAAGEARNIKTPEITKIKFQSEPALQTTYCFDENKQCRLLRKFTRDGYLYNIILDAPQKHFEKAVQTAETMLKMLNVSGE